VLQWLKSRQLLCSKLWRPQRNDTQTVRRQYDVCVCVLTFTHHTECSDAVLDFVLPYSCPVSADVFVCGVQRLESKADNSPSSAEIKNEWRYTSTPSYAFVACTGNLPILSLLCSDTFSVFQYHPINDLWLHEKTNFEDSIRT
jgi:hypothetical protein